MPAGQERMTALRRRAVDQLLMRYLELPDEEQQAFLAMCQTRYRRLAQWLTQLVDSGNTMTLLDSSIRRMAGAAVRSDSDDIDTLTPGFRLGPWEVVAAVGQGGMGMVYRGRRADGAFEMDVAIKLISKRRHGLADLLRRECRLLARLDHPAVTRLVDAGLDEKAGPFLVMEWVEGLDLQHWLDQMAPALPPRLALFESLVAATSHAHQRLIVHGDIKPANIRVRTDGSVKLMDFGVARLLESEGSDETRISALTPTFAAPEQLEGEPITPRSDIWSLGALLFWLLGGEARSLDTEKIQTAIRPQTGARSPELTAIICKACAQDAEQRYASGAELLADIQAFRNHLPLSAIPATRAYRLAKFCRRNPILLGGVAATMLALTGGLVIATLMYLEAENARLQVAQEQKRVEARAAELEQVVTFQQAQLADINVEMMGLGMRSGLIDRRQAFLADRNQDETQIAAGIAELEGSLTGIDFTDFARDVLDRQIFERTLDSIDKQFAEQPLIRARLLRTMARTLRELGLAERALEPALTAVQLHREHLGDDHPETLASINRAGAIHIANLNLEQAIEKLTEAVEVRQRVLGDMHEETLDSLHSLGVAYHWQGDLENAERYYREALEKRLKVMDEDHPHTLLTMSGLGVVFRSTGRLDKAEEYGLRALEGSRRVRGNDHPHTINMITGMGFLHWERGQLDATRQYLEEAFETSRRTMGTRHPEFISAQSNYGRFLDYIGLPEKAEPHLHQSLQKRREILGVDHLLTISSINLLARLYQHQDKPESALPLRRRQLDLYRRTVGENHSMTLAAMTNLGLVLSALGDHARARRYLSEALDGCRATLGHGHRQTLTTQIHLASVLTLKGEVEQSIALGDPAIDGLRKAFPPDHWRLGAALRLHGLTLAADEQFGDAEVLLTEAMESIQSYLGTNHWRTRQLGQDLADLYQRWHDSRPIEGHDDSARKWADWLSKS